MDRIVLVASFLLVVVNIYSEMVLANPRYEPSIDPIKEDISKFTPVWLGSSQGRRKRNLKSDITELQLAQLWGALTESPAAIITIDENDTFVCKNVPGNRFYLIAGDKADFIPRLGRNVGEIVQNDKWPKSIPSEVDERSPPFAPRLGRRLSPYSPRLGREA